MSKSPAPPTRPRAPVDLRPNADGVRRLQAQRATPVAPAAAAPAASSIVVGIVPQDVRKSTPPPRGGPRQPDHPPPAAAPKRNASPADLGQQKRKRATLPLPKDKAAIGNEEAKKNQRSVIEQQMEASKRYNEEIAREANAPPSHSSSSGVYVPSVPVTESKAMTKEEEDAFTRTAFRDMDMAVSLLNCEDDERKMLRMHALFHKMYPQGRIAKAVETHNRTRSSSADGTVATSSSGDNSWIVATLPPQLAEKHPKPPPLQLDAVPQHYRDGNTDHYRIDTPTGNTPRSNVLQPDADPLDVFSAQNAIPPPRAPGRASTGRHRHRDVRNVDVLDQPVTWPTPQPSPAEDHHDNHDQRR